MKKRIKATELNQFLKNVTNDFYSNHIKTMAHKTVDLVPVQGGTARDSIRASANRPLVEWGEKDPTGSRAKSQINQLNITIDENGFVTCGVPYAGAIEFGSSSRAPGGFMRVTVSEAQLWADEVTKK